MMTSLTLLNSGVERADHSLYVEHNITNTIHTQDRLTIRSGQFMIMIGTSAGRHLVRTRAEKVGGVFARARKI